MPTIFRSLLGLAVCLLLPTAFAIDIQAAEIPADEWQPITMTAPWAAREGAGLLSYQGKRWLLGGWNPHPALREFFPLVCNNEVWSSADGVEWQQITPREPCWSARGMIGGSAVMNGRIWILGGGTYDPPTTPPRKFYNDVWSSADGIDWPRHTAEAPGFPRQSYDVPVWDNPLWVIEGYHEKGGKRNDVWDSPDGVQWTELSDTPWKPRHAASLIVHNGSLWMIAVNNCNPMCGA